MVAAQNSETDSWFCFAEAADAATEDGKENLRENFYKRKNKIALTAYTYRIGGKVIFL